jgi:hypothetical protein
MICRPERLEAGMTLIEVLLAITLLTAILLAALSWTRTSGVLVARTSGSARWEAAAESVFQLIDTDLRTGDFLTEPGDLQPFPQVRVEGDRLFVQTRSRRPGGGGVIREYAVLPREDLLQVTERPLRRSTQVPTTRALLGEVRRLELVEPEMPAGEDGDTRGKPLTVRLESENGIIRERRFRLP